MLDAKELDCFAVGENKWVIRRVCFDEQGRRCHQFIAYIANATTNNQEVAEEFIKGIAALQNITGVCRCIQHYYIDGVCAQCGSKEPQAKP